MEKNQAPETDYLPDTLTRDAREPWHDSELAPSECGPLPVDPILRSGPSSTIAEMARDFEVTIRTLRFYEERGLLHPRRAGAARYYSARDRLHLRMILKGKELGFTLTEIRDILLSREEPERPSGSRSRKQAEPADDRVTKADWGKGQGGTVEIDLAQIDLAKIDPTKLDLAMGLRPEQITAQIEHLDRQRRRIDEAILALREAHRRRCMVSASCAKM